MKPRIMVVVAAFFTFAIAGTSSSAFGQTQKSSPRKGQLPPASPNTTPSRTQPEVQYQGDKLGDLNTPPIAGHMTVIMQIDSMVQQADRLKQRAESYSESFLALAENHHGADKKEILMMQRMSESMGVMAGEIKMSLVQYKDMLEEETPSESRKTKAEVLSFKDVLGSIERDVDRAVNTLQRLQERLGQG